MNQISLELAQTQMREFIQTGDYLKILPHQAGNPKFDKRPIPGRNEPCLCGSGIKYKKCCGSVN